LLTTINRACLKFIDVTFADRFELRRRSGHSEIIEGRLKPFLKSHNRERQVIDADRG
jgi:hypothetical protein